MCLGTVRCLMAVLSVLDSCCGIVQGSPACRGSPHLYDTVLTCCCCCCCCCCGRPATAVQVSGNACEDVIRYCIDKQDYFAAAEAWVYARVYCADPSRRHQSAADDAAWQAANPHQEQQPQEQEQPQQQLDGPLGWSSISLMRTYGVGLAAWLQAGCVSKGHTQYVRGQLEQLVAELDGRGATVPSKLKQALEAPASAPVDAAAPATADQPAAADGSVADLVEDVAAESKTEPTSAA